jgi:hypothetical protein
MSAVETIRALLAERILVEHGGTHGSPVSGTACPGVEA